MDQLKSALPEGLRIGKIHHVAIIVRDLESVLDLYRDKLGLTVETVMPILYDRVTIGFLPVGEVKIELVQPDDDTTGAAKFLEARARASTTSASRCRTSRLPSTSWRRTGSSSSTDCSKGRRRPRRIRPPQELPRCPGRADRGPWRPGLVEVEY